jgi:hypothetical protein
MCLRGKGGTTERFGLTDAQHGCTLIGAFQMIQGILEKAARLRRHRSIPSRLISCMSGDRSA